jgi:hypothetical protein
MNRQNLILAAVIGHLLLTSIHGLVHAAVPVFPTGRNAAFAVVFLYVLPVLGAGLVVYGRRGMGATLLFSAGLASLIFEGALHFLIANPDHVAHISSHRTSFGLTAVLTTASNFFVLAAGYLSGRDTWHSTSDIGSTVES